MRTLALALPLLLVASSCMSSGDDPSYPSCSSTVTSSCVDQLVVQGRDVPFYRSASSRYANSSAREVVIAVHGSARNASDVFHTVTDVVSVAAESTIVIAPHFECEADDPSIDDVFWPCDGPYDWSHGGNDTAGSPTPVSSYDVIDQLVAMFTDSASFPYLDHVVITGIGAGGQLVDRYAATNAIDPMPGVQITYAAVAPASYMWLDAARPASTAGCSDYDSYPYGLDDRLDFVAAPTAATVVDRLRTRDVSYWVGGRDTLANSAGTGLDTSCEANAQGIDRLARAEAFEASIDQLGGTQPLVVVPACAHSRTCMYESPQLASLLIGD